MEDVLVDRRDGVATIVIDRPEVHNALRRQTYEELTQAFRQVASEPEIGVVVLRGAGDRAFSSGGDVREQRSRTPEAARRHLARLQELALAIRNCGKPVIAAVQGYCLGAGNELNLFCDITVAAENAVFGQVGPMVGSAPIWGATQILPRVVGEKRAREMIFRCRRYSAREAYEMGLVNEVVPVDSFDDAVRAWCRDLLERSPQALRLAKLSLNYAVDAMLPSFLAGAEMLAQIAGSEEQREGASAFLEKRAPDWSRFRRGRGEGE